MKKIADSIPHDVFETLGGRPAVSDLKDNFAGCLRACRKELADGLETLDETSAYSNLLRSEIARYLPGIAVRLKIGGETAEMAQLQQLLTNEVLSIACEILNGSFDSLKELLPEIRPVPTESGRL